MLKTNTFNSNNQMCGTKDSLDFDPYMGTNMFKQADISCICEIHNFFKVCNFLLYENLAA